MRFLHIALLPFIATVLLAWSDPGHDGESAARRVRERYDRQLDALSASVDRFAQMVRSGSDDSASVSSAFIELRSAWKKIEWIAEVYDPRFTARANGIPFAHVIENDPSRPVVQPEGLQTMELAIYSNGPNIDRPFVLRLAARLKQALDAHRIAMRGVEFDDRHLFDALRDEVVRIAALGNAGYDTPASTNSIAESSTAMRSIADACGEYDRQLARKDPALAGLVDSLLNGACAMLARGGGDFDGFDRASYIRGWSDPLYAALYRAQRALRIETFRESVGYNKAVHDEAAGMFATDFLDPSFFSPDAYKSRSLATVRWKIR
jgi:cytochrome c peroxidase